MQPVVNYDHKTIQVRRGTTTEWRRYGAICVPAEGEICVEFFQDADGTRNGNTGMKVGNGIGNYTDLPYLITNQNADDRISDEQINNWDLTVEKLANLTAAEIAQDNDLLGDNVQEALNDLHARLLSIDPDGGSIEINDIPGLEDALKDKADKDHTHDEYLTDAPNNGKQYVRQSEAWAEVTISGGGAPAWDDVTGKPADYPPSAHDHAWDSITGKPADYPPSAHGHAWGEITGKPSEFPPASHNHDGVYQPVGDYIEDANSDGKQYARQDGAWSEIAIPDGGGGASVHIGDTPPDSPEEGQQWLETPAGGDAKMWIWDGAVWLEQPSNATGSEAPVDSVNGKIGEVVLTASDVGALPDSTVIPPPTDLTGYATETWVTNQNFATQTWVNNKNYSTYTGGDAVKTSGSQTIGGAKTFSSNVTAPDFVATSDERLKTNIATVPLGAIDKIRGVEFDWRVGGERASGVIAQEVEAVPALSHLVRNSEDENQTRVVSYLGLIPYLIEEVKALKLEVQALKDGS